MLEWRGNGEGVRRQVRIKFREDLVPCANAQEVISKVGKDRNGIGFFAWNDELTKESLAAVKVIPITDGDGNRPVAPPLEPTIDEDYPLARRVSLWLHPDAPPQAREFCEFAVSREAARIANAKGIWTRHDADETLGKRRLTAVAQGTGSPVIMTGTDGFGELAKEAALRFVKDREAVQVKYQKKLSRKDAEQAFRDAQAEIIVGERTEDRAQEAVERKSLTLGYASLGVIVHPELKLNSLQLDELRQICSGAISEWPAASGKGAAIKGCGLASDDPVMKAFRELRDGGSEAGDQRGRKEIRPLQLTHFKDTAAVIASVARDSTAIGFVDLSQMPAGGGGVTVVKIDGRRGETASGRVGECEALRVPYVLYLSPKAGPAAVRFFDWLEENLPEERYPGEPSPDEPLSNAGKIVRESPLKDVLAKHGLLPAVRYVTEKKDSDALLAEHREPLAPQLDDENAAIAPELPLEEEVERRPIPQRRQPAANKRTADLAMTSPPQPDKPAVSDREPLESKPPQSKSEGNAPPASHLPTLLASGVGVSAIAVLGLLWFAASLKKQKKRPKKRYEPTLELPKSLPVAKRLKDS